MVGQVCLWSSLLELSISDQELLLSNGHQEISMLVSFTISLQANVDGKHNAH